MLIFAVHVAEFVEIHIKINYGWESTCPIRVPQPNSKIFNNGISLLLVQVGVACGTQLTTSTISSILMPLVLVASSAWQKMPCREAANHFPVYQLMGGLFGKDVI